MTLNMLTEPKIGEVRKSRELGYKHDGKYIWIACKKCGKCRWVQYVRGEPVDDICGSCGQLNSNKRKTYRYTNKASGYICVYVRRDDPYASMTNKAGFVQEHRYVMAQSLGRCLETWEVVHHLNGIKDDNRIENLTIIATGSQHALYEGALKRIKQLQSENAALKEQLRKVGNYKKFYPSHIRKTT